MKNTIKAHKNFMFRDSEMLPMPAFFTKFRPKLFATGQYGLVVSKRVFRLAVVRNRAKRLLRAWIYRSKLPKDFDVIFIARPKIFETKLSDGVGQMRKVLKQVKTGVPPGAKI